jgi:flagellin-like hook-associated protein FlgL
MSGIVLTAAVRQNLLSLQGTADLLAATQGRLSTGKKVNSALDNPTNFFTAQGLDNRASDINNLLDSIGNGVQVLQAANTGLTSLQKLVDTAKSIANQVLQAPTGYSAKSASVSSAAVVVNPLNGSIVDGALIKVGETFDVPAFAGGTATTFTFTATSTLADLNASLAADNLSAVIDKNGNLNITTTNDVASKTGPTVTIGGTIGTLTFAGPTTPTADAASQTTRANLVAQYNNIITQITTTAQDSSFNGINLLNGDNLKLTFDETGKSTLNITGATYDATSLGLNSLVSGTDFLDSSSANAALSKLNAASTTLRTAASAFGANLSVVQNRQDFNKNLIQVLQTGSSNLTLADTNEEAANSQALSTRQSIATSALSLANQSQQSVLQLLR